MNEMLVFIENVREMRRLQKLYEKTKDYMVQRKRKALEDIVDKSLQKSRLSNDNEPKQKELFT